MDNQDKPSSSPFSSASPSSSSPYHGADQATTPLNTSNNVLIPQGQVAIATVLGATLADGLTPVSIPALSNALTTYYATASTTFTPEHIGQLVTCIEIHTHNQLVITGVVMPTQPAELEAHSLLDEAIEHTQSPQAKSAQQEPVDSALAQSLDNHMGDDIEPFDEFDCVSGADNVDETSAEEYAFFNQQGAQAHAVIRGEQSIVLQCGASSLMLLADGRIKINGKYIHSRASHVHRIAGSTVKVN